MFSPSIPLYSHINFKRIFVRFSLSNLFFKIKLWGICKEKYKKSNEKLTIRENSNEKLKDNKGFFSRKNQVFMRFYWFFYLNFQQFIIMRRFEKI